MGTPERRPVQAIARVLHQYLGSKPGVPGLSGENHRAAGAPHAEYQRTGLMPGIPQTAFRQFAPPRASSARYMFTARSLMQSKLRGMPVAAPRLPLVVTL